MLPEDEGRALKGVDELKGVDGLERVPDGDGVGGDGRRGEDVGLGEAGDVEQFRDRAHGSVGEGQKGTWAC